VDEFGDVRSLLHGERTQSTWEAICTWLEQRRATEDGSEDPVVDYVLAQIEQWPVALRTCPADWLRLMLPAEAVPMGMFAELLNVVRTLDVNVLLAVRRSAPQAGDLARVLAVDGWTKLERLVWQDVPMGRDDFSALATHPAMSHVRELSLGRRGLDDEMVPWAEALGAITQWSPRVVRLDEMALTDHPFEILCGSPGFEGVEEMSVRGTYVSDRGLARVVRLPQIASWKSLDLSFTQVTEMGLAYLLSSEHLGGLERVDATGIMVSDVLEAAFEARGVELVRRESARGVALMDMTVSSYVPWCLRRVFDLDDDPDVHVGRVHSAGNHVVIRSPTMSSRQFTVSWHEDEGVVVRDDESTGGTYVDGRRVGEPRALSERERVQVGRMLFRFRLM